MQLIIRAQLFFGISKIENPTYMFVLHIWELESELIVGLGIDKFLWTSSNTLSNMDWLHMLLQSCLFTFVFGFSCMFTYFIYSMFFFKLSK